MDFEEKLRCSRLDKYYQDKLDELEEDMNHLIEFILDPHQDYCFDDVKALNFIMSQIKKIRKIIIDKEKKENGK